MCGIAGIYAFNARANGAMSHVAEALPALARRGPDAEGVYRNESVCLAHTRLSIQDTSTAASQPFSDPSGRYTLIFNGEFFNYREYRKSLEAEGQAFRSTSDTEVLLYLLIKFGEKAIPLINGFFSFAFYDRNKECLLIARDRYGIKPLYFYKDSTMLCFASELKALRVFGVLGEPDPASLRMFFHLNYIPDPWTAYEGVSKLEPGTFLKISKSSIEHHSYYSLPERSTYSDYDKARNDLKILLEDSVKLRLAADVPLGCFLSGGIDSSVIAALASNHTGRLKTFSIGFADEPYFDETKYARMVADRYKTDHTEFRLNSRDLLGVLDDVLFYPDEPFADSSALAVYILSRETRKHVTVALSGDGADELFAGYNKHAAELRALSMSRFAGISKQALPLLEMLPSGRNSFVSNKIRQAKKFAKGLQSTAGERYWEWAGYNEENSNYIFSGQEYTRRKYDLISEIDSSDFNSVLKTDMRLVLAGDMLTKVDRMSMANSLEVRCPFLDYRIVDLAFNLPASFKIDSNKRKKIVRDTFGNLLPEPLLNRPKQGFEVPLLKWFRNELKSRLDAEVFNKEKIISQGILDPDKVMNVRSRLHSSNPGDAAAQTYGLLAFQVWYTKNFR